MHVALKSAGAISMEIEYNVLHIFDFVEGEFEGDLMEFDFEDFAVLFRGVEELFVIEKSRGSDKHEAEGFLDGFGFVGFDSVDEGRGF